MKATAFLLLFWICISAATGQVQQFEDDKLRPSISHEFDYFGRAVAIGEGMALAGSRVGSPYGYGAGAVFAYLYDPGTKAWIESAIIYPSQGTKIDSFGSAVSLCGDVALIGAPKAENHEGAAYIFCHDPGSRKWIEEAKLLPWKTGDGFGCTVGLHDDLALIGDPGYSDLIGAAYLFRYNPVEDAWLVEAILRNPDAVELDGYGSVVALHGDVALVASPIGDDYLGLVHVFRFDSDTGKWKKEARLQPQELVYMDKFGASLSLHENVAVIGATGDDGGNGAVYIYRYHPGQKEWIEEDKLLAPLGSVWGDEFGCSVDVHDDVLVVGACDAKEFYGAAYRYRYSPGLGTWKREVELVGSDTYEFGDYGYAVAVHENLMLIGRPGWGYAAMYGAAYLFEAKSLIASDDRIVYSQGGDIDFNLFAGEDNAERKYLVLGSLSGTEPGFPLPGGQAVLPLNWDAFTDAILPLANTPGFENFLGMLDGCGDAVAALHAGPMPPSAIGLDIFFAYCLNGPFDFASNPVSIWIVPK
ncbi:MAG: hypothetical protein ACYTG7_06935 [Planctomycetota bacterium]|jgi:hypothetical protein